MILSRIDIVRFSTRRLFATANPVAHFLTSKEGAIAEKPILHSDLNTFSEVCDANIVAASDVAIKLIYLRRKFEILGQIDASSDVLSSLLHLRAVPDRPICGEEREPLDIAEVEEAAAKISKAIPGFNYSQLLSEFRDIGRLKAKFAATDVGYEKVQISRTMLEIHKPQEDDTFRKFVNETFHIENEYVRLRDPRDFDSVPEFVVAECVCQVEPMPAV